MSSSSLIAPFKRPLFRRLAATYAINELGDWMGIVALSVLVFDETGSALATAALFLATSFLPALLAPLFVARAELPPPGYALPLIYCAEAAAFGGLALISGGFSLAAVLALAALDGVLMLGGRALTRAVVASLLAPIGELRSGNAILNFSFTGGAALGPALAGLVVAGFGVTTALLFDALSFLVVAGILATAGRMPRAEPEAGRLRERVAAGIGYIRRRPALRWLLAAQGAAFVFFSMVLPIEVIYAKETLAAGDSGYGLLLGCWGGGMVLGSIIFASARRTALAGLLLISTLTVAAGYLGMAAAPSLVVACLAAALGGAGNGVQWVSVVSAIQELTAEQMQARVMSVLESIAAAMPGIGFLAGGAIAALIDPRAAFVFAGAGIVLIVAIFAPLLGRNRSRRSVGEDLSSLDRGDDVVLELIPGGPHPKPKFDPEVEP